MSERRRESDLNPDSKVKVTIREMMIGAFFLFSLGGSVYGLYTGIVSKLDLQNAEFKGAMNVQQGQIQGVKDAVDDLKKRLDLHEQRTWGKDSRQ